MGPVQIYKFETLSTKEVFVSKLSFHVLKKTIISFFPASGYSSFPKQNLQQLIKPRLLCNKKL